MSFENVPAQLAPIARPPSQEAPSATLMAPPTVGPAKDKWWSASSDPASRLHSEERWTSCRSWLLTAGIRQNPVPDSYCPNLPSGPCTHSRPQPSAVGSSAQLDASASKRVVFPEAARRDLPLPDAQMVDACIELDERAAAVKPISPDRHLIVSSGPPPTPARRQSILR